MNTVYFARVEKLDLEKLAPFLMDRRLRKIERLQIPLDKVRSAGCELLLRKHLLKSTNAPNLEYTYQAGGKPHLKHHKDVFFNYSHSEAFSGCVVSDYEVGLDMERVRDYTLEKVEKLSTRVMNLNQKNEILKDKLPVERFIEHWVVKESFSKLVGLGMSLPFRTIFIDWDEQLAWVEEDKKAHFVLKKFENIYIGATSFNTKEFTFEFVEDLSQTRKP